MLVDLNGHSDQDRMPCCCTAPRRCRSAGRNIYATTGFAAFDCVVGDAWTIPPEEERFCIERVRRVPSTYLAFDLSYPAPEVAPPPCLTEGHITFGGMVFGYKITDPVIESWSRILHAVPDSRLLLRNRGWGASPIGLDMVARFAAQGIEPARLTLEGGGEHFDFLRTYARIDIALDAFPYNGGTSTAEALCRASPS